MTEVAISTLIVATSPISDINYLYEHTDVLRRNVLSHLEFDTKLFQILQNIWKDETHSASEYWTGYVESITKIITRDGLSGFGDNYYLTQGFGDALRYETPRRRLRRLLMIPAIYKFVEKQLVIKNHKKVRNTIYKKCEPVFLEKGFVKYLSQEVSSAPRDLGISRFIEIDGNKVPLRYWMFLIYLEMLLDALKLSGIDSKDILSGNYMDIGGGYGATVDGIYLYKQYKSLGRGGINYLLDQFPVTFIANQYLKYRRNGQMLPLIYSENKHDTADSRIDENVGSGESFCRVIQNTATDHISGLNISLFFNSNSFQEMDKQQIHEYCGFMNANKASNAYLALYLYDSEKDGNSPDPALEIFNQYFSLKANLPIGRFFEQRHVKLPDASVIKGGLYLYKIA